MSAERQVQQLACLAFHSIRGPVCTCSQSCDACGRLDAPQVIRNIFVNLECVL